MDGLQVFPWSILLVFGISVGVAQTTRQPWVPLATTFTVGLESKDGLSFPEKKRETNQMLPSWTMNKHPSHLWGQHFAGLNSGLNGGFFRFIGQTKKNHYAREHSRGDVLCMCLQIWWCICLLPDHDDWLDIPLISRQYDNTTPWDGPANHLQYGIPNTFCFGWK